MTVAIAIGAWVIASFLLALFVGRGFRFFGRCDGNAETSNRTAEATRSSPHNALAERAKAAPAPKV